MEDSSARGEDGVEKIKRDLPICNKVCNTRERLAIALAEVVEEDAE